MQRLKIFRVVKNIRAMKEKENFWVMMKNETSWDKMSVRQKVILSWLGISFVLLFVAGESLLLSIVAVANFGITAYAVRKYIPMEDE